MSIVTVDFVKYGYSKYFVFDSESWRDRVFISGNNPESALRLISNLMKDNDVILKCSVDLVDLVNMIIKKKVKDFEI